MTAATLAAPEGAAPDDAPAEDPAPERGRSFQERLARNRWWLVRTAVLPVHVLLFAVAVFFIVRAIPGDPILNMTGGQITPEQHAAARAALGLDGSIPEQLSTFLGRVVRLDLGTSIVTGRSVWGEFAQRLPATLELAVLGMISAGAFTLAACYILTTRPRNVVSWVLRGYARLAGAVPEFVIGIAFIFVFYATLRWAPAPTGRVHTSIDLPPAITNFPLIDSLIQGRFDAVGSMAARLVLPVLVMTLGHSAVLIKLLSSSMDEAVDAPPTRFRIASGARRWSVIASVYRRALPSAATMFGAMFGTLLGGAVILEQLFGLGGMGQYAVDAVNASDISAIQGFLIVMAALSLVVFMLVDLLNMLLDPRRRPGVRTEVSS